MNKRPVDYKQYDRRWADKPYCRPGGTGTVKSSGCGPACAAMLIETLTGKTYTPEDACGWSMEHGYRTLNQGTEYAYFVPQFAAFGIHCHMLNWTNTYGRPDHANHTRALELLKQGNYLIALMGKGTWTASGHFVVVWWEDGKVRINDPASARTERLNGDPAVFRREVRYYWAVGAKPARDKGGKSVKVELPVLKKGSRGQAVRSLQMLLNASGFDCGEADGSFGSATDAALRSCQKANGLTVDGQCGPQVYGLFWPV